MNESCLQKLFCISQGSWLERLLFWIFTFIAISRKEDFDLWLDQVEKLKKIGFIKWYIPCIGRTQKNFVKQLYNILLKPIGIKSKEDKKLCDDLLKHLEFSGKGIFGDVLRELRSPKYWSTNENGKPYILVDKLTSKENIQYDAWMQDVLTLNWAEILGGLFAGSRMDEKEDRAKISIYHLIDWITDKQIFTKDQLLEAARNSKLTISDNKIVLEEVALNLLHILFKLGFLKYKEPKNAEQYKICWDKSFVNRPQKILIKKRISFSNSKKNFIKSRDVVKEYTTSAVTLFYSYAHKDEDLRNTLDTHLETLKDNGIIIGWHDRCITPGSQWRNDILSEIEKADVILLLVSPDFLASDFCKIEMEIALQRHNFKKSLIIPIIVRPANWRNTSLAKLQVLPKDAKPVTTWKNYDNAWLDVTLGIQNVINEKFKKSGRK